MRRRQRMAEEARFAIGAFFVRHRISLTPSLSRQVFREQVIVFTGIPRLHLRQCADVWELFACFIPLNCASVTGEFLSDLLLRYLCIYASSLKRTLRMTSAYPDGNILFFSSCFLLVFLFGIITHFHFRGNIFHITRHICRVVKIIAESGRIIKN